MQLAHKFAEKSLNEQYQQQRKMLETFAYDFAGKMRAILNEMQGDLSTLKYKDYSRDQRRKLGLFYYSLLEKTKDLDPNTPYESANKIIQYVLDKNNLSMISDLNKDIQQYLKENEIDLGPAKSFKQVRVNSLANLVKLMHWANLYMKTNPLIDEPDDTIPPPTRMNTTQETIDPRFQGIGPEALTNPGVKAK